MHDCGWCERPLGRRKDKKPEGMLCRKCEPVIPGFLNALAEQALGELAARACVSLKEIKRLYAN